MRFLIIDDDDSKISLLNKFLMDQGVPKENILIARHAAEARVTLSRNTIDIMLIDVLLPVRNGARPAGETSVELLRQIIEDGASPAPRHIIGVTASHETIQEFRNEFRSLVTQVLHVSPELEDWKVDLQGFLAFIKRAESEQKSFDYDICVLNALRTPELEMVYETWPMQLEAEKLIGRNITYRAGTISFGEKKLKIVCAHLSQVGPIAATHTTESILREFRPRVLIMTGICGGFADHVSIGDVVIAEKSWDWQAGKWSEEGTLLSAIEPKEGSPELVAIARSVDTHLVEFYESYTGYRPKSPPTLKAGPMVTGSSVVASLDIQKVFKDQHRKMCAIDMECYGLYYSCANHAGLATKVVCIKAVSDLADRGKDDDFQKYCSFISAKVGLKTLEKYFSQS